MKKIISVAAAFVMVMAGVIFGTAAPASASVSGYSCKYYNGGNTCFRAWWYRQADGTGVRLSGIEVITENCASAFDQPPYGNTMIGFGTPGGVSYGSTNFGDEPCHFYKDFNANGQDGGSMLVGINARARYNNTFNRNVEIIQRINPDGSWSTEVSRVYG